MNLLHHGLLLIALGTTINLHAKDPLAAITIDYPADRTLFPPDIAPPTFQWRDAEPAATVWRIEVAGIKLKSNGERLRIGEIDERCAQAGADTLK